MAFMACVNYNISLRCHSTLRYLTPVYTGFRDKCYIDKYDTVKCVKISAKCCNFKEYIPRQP